MAINEQTKVRLMMTVFLGMVGLIMIGFFYFILGRGMINDYRRRAGDVRVELEENKEQLAQIDALMAQRDEIEAQAATIRKVTRRLPSSPDAPGFLNEMVKVLRTTGIFQEEVKPKSTHSYALYTEIPYQIKAYGYYHAFGQFLTLIEQNPDRFMRVKSMTITNNLSRPSVHPIEMEIATFMFKQATAERNES